VHLTSAEVVLELWQEVALRDSGLVSFGYHRGPSDGFAFVATCQQTPVYESEEATVSHRLTADLRYVLAAGRFVHYLRAIVRDQPPGRLSGSERKSMLNNWIASYVSADAEQNPQRPLGAAYLDIAGPAGGLTLASFYALPKFQLEPLAFGFRTLFRLPPG
jgi:type VI secretion system protein ImpC